MARPFTQKIVIQEPKINYFKPAGIPLREMEEVTITIEELEAMRLTNLEELNQTQSAKIMNVHQSTFQRTLNRARKKITDALINGKAIRMEGGNYATKSFGHCTCKKCGYKENHTPGKPCRMQNCPKCEIPLMKE